MRLKCLPACPLAPGPDAARIPGTCARHPSADPVGSPVLAKGCDHPQGRRWWRGWSKYWYGQGESDCYSHMCKSCWLWVRGQSQASPPLRLVAWLLTLHACPHDMSPGHGSPLTLWQCLDISHPGGWSTEKELSARIWKGPWSWKGDLQGLCPVSSSAGPKMMGEARIWTCLGCRQDTLDVLLHALTHPLLGSGRGGGGACTLHLPSSGAKCHPYQALASIPQSAGAYVPPRRADVPMTLQGLSGTCNAW